MTELLPLVITFAVGAATAGLFLLILWLSVRSLAQSQAPRASLFASFLLRHGIVIASFYFSNAFAAWAGLLCALLGFMAVRLLLSAALLFTPAAPQRLSR